MKFKRFHNLKTLVVLVLCGAFFFMGQAQANSTDNFIRSVDVMKYTKDTVTNQPSDAQIDSIVSVIVNEIHPDYIAISVPLDDSADYPAGSKPAPRSAIAFTQKWVDSIHAHGAKVIFRGTWSGIEGIYGFKKLVGPNRFPTGTDATAATDGSSTWLGKIYQYITVHPDLFGTGDIWAIMPERTEGVFQDSTSFLSSDGGMQANYAHFFSDVDKVSAQAFGNIGKSVKTGYTANNFSELASGWMPSSLYAGEPYITVDHYGITHTPAEMENDLTAVSRKYGKPVFLQEWGDYWNTAMSAADRSDYLASMYAVFSKLAHENILAGFNYWGGWINNAEGVLTESSGVYGIDARGQMLANFFEGLRSGAATTIPVQTQVPLVIASKPFPKSAAAITVTPAPATGPAGNKTSIDPETPPPSQIASGATASRSYPSPGRQRYFEACLVFALAAALFIMVRSLRAKG